MTTSTNKNHFITTMTIRMEQVRLKNKIHVPFELKACKVKANVPPFLNKIRVI